jgi:hypothetical protein
MYTFFRKHILTEQILAESRKKKDEVIVKVRAIVESMIHVRISELKYPVPFIVEATRF